MADDLRVGRELLARCLESPDDRAPQLVYADWLEERGHRLADVIRADSDREAAAIAAPHLDDWLGEARPWFRADTMFERGMLRRVYGGTGTYTAKATQALLVDIAETFGVRETMLRGQSSRLGTCEALAFTTRLHWWGCQLPDARVVALAESPHLARLTSLVFEKIHCTDVGLRALAASPHLARLRAFGLRAPVYLGSYTASGVVAILDALAIESLDLTGPTRVDLAQIVNAPSAAKLRRLFISGSSRDTVRAVVSGSQLHALEHLALDCFDRLADDDLAPIFGNRALARLASLHVHCRDGLAPELAARLRERFGDRLVAR